MEIIMKRFKIKYRNKVMMFKMKNNLILMVVAKMKIRKIITLKKN